mmetsp:Transcript_26521/g.66470  ORF Transcript_26521/g.66470 Transcript_26521/m.66470 type:complete len:241 (+) Transcript_26521:177-899(+)
MAAPKHNRSTTDAQRAHGHVRDCEFQSPRTSGWLRIPRNPSRAYLPAPGLRSPMARPAKSQILHVGSSRDVLCNSDSRQRWSASRFEPHVRRGPRLWNADRGGPAPATDLYPAHDHLPEELDRAPAAASIAESTSSIRSGLLLYRRALNNPRRRRRPPLGPYPVGPSRAPRLENRGGSGGVLHWRDDQLCERGLRFVDLTVGAVRRHGGGYVHHGGVYGCDVCDGRLAECKYSRESHGWC